MLAQRIISEGNNGNRMEVIGKEDKTLKTLHIHKEYNVWKYFVGCDKEGRKVYAPITVSE